jgi:hypothetical protein
MNAAVSFDLLLESGETLTGIPNVSGSPSGLTIDNVRVSSDTLTINGFSVSAGRAVQFRVSDGQAGKKYELTVSCSTNSSPAQTLVVECPLHVL